MYIDVYIDIRAGRYTDIFNNPVFLQGWVIPPFLLQKGQRGTAAFAQQRAFARLVSLNRRKKEQFGSPARTCTRGHF